MSIITINPSNGTHLKEYAIFSDEKIKLIIHEANNRFLEWKMNEVQVRIKYFQTLAQLLEDKKQFLAETMALEMGKPLKDGKAEIEKCAWVCRYYATNSIQFLADLEIETDAGKSYVTYEPLGIVLAIMPWNFPFWQVFRFAVPALIAGNTAVLKHSPNVTECALQIEEIFRAAGFPEFVFTTLVADVGQVESIIGNPDIKAVTLTGSTRAGKAVAAQAGANLKKVVLELGGSDPYLVFRDANLDKAVNQCASGRLINNGQSCIAAKRFIVEKPLVEAFTEKLVRRFKNTPYGDPYDQGTELGPMAREDLRDNLHQQVLDSIEKGAVCLSGGDIPDSPGFFYPPTVLTGAKKGMPVYDEEIFGPVAVIIPADDQDHALDIANDTVYGLGAAIFTSDVSKGEILAKTRLNAGSCFVNAFVRSDPRLPFGGIKQSGYGRELSEFGIKEFVNIKTIYIN